jgi:hypothetical protein
MQNARLFVGHLSKDAEASLGVNGGQTILANLNPYVVLVNFQAKRYEVRAGQRLYWLDNGDMIHVERRMSDDQDVMYRHEESELDTEEQVIAHQYTSI